MAEYTTSIAECKNCGRPAKEHDGVVGVPADLSLKCPIGGSKFEFAKDEDRIANFAEGVMNGFILITDVPAEYRDRVQELCSKFFTQQVIPMRMRSCRWENGEIIED